MPANYDLSGLALPAGNAILYDDKNMPSIMVRIPKMTYAELGLGSDTSTFPAFIVNGQEVDEIYISKYLNIVDNGRAYSLPARKPANDIDFDTALGYCTAKGEGWHLMTAFEWGALILWCELNGFIPLGNNGYGKHSSESAYHAIPAAKDSSHFATRTLTGTGPLEWYHDKSLAGIADLCGNVHEWTGGIRTVKGELQIMVNNNAADKNKSQEASSAEWKAINASSGALITPNGSGTTSGSIKMDWVSSKLTYHTSITDASPGSHYCNFPDITKTSSIGAAAVTLLQALGLYPKTGSIITDSRCYIDNGADERSFCRGGNCSISSLGFASFHGSSDRAYHNGYIGFRSAYCKLPAA